MMSFPTQPGADITFGGGGKLNVCSSELASICKLPFSFPLEGVSGVAPHLGSARSSRWKMTEYLGTDSKDAREC